MKRDVLTDAVRRTAEDLGYAFHAGPDRLIPARVFSLPAIWLSPAKLKSHQSRRECVDTYQIGLYLMTASVPGTRENSEPLWALLESDAAEIFSRLPAERNIRRTHGLKCSPVVAAFTKAGEIAVEAEMCVELHYCK